MASRTGGVVRHTGLWLGAWTGTRSQKDGQLWKKGPAIPNGCGRGRQGDDGLVGDRLSTELATYPTCAPPSSNNHHPPRKLSTTTISSGLSVTTTGNETAGPERTLAQVLVHRTCPSATALGIGAAAGRPLGTGRGDAVSRRAANTGLGGATESRAATADWSADESGMSVGPDRLGRSDDETAATNRTTATPTATAKRGGTRSRFLRGSGTPQLRQTDA
jgi:hypothetical protein